MKDNLKSKVRASAHTQLIDTNVNVNKNVNVNVNVYRKPKFEDLYTRGTFYIENDLLELLNQVAGSEKGEKTRIINDALKMYFER